VLDLSVDPINIKLQIPEPTQGCSTLLGWQHWGRPATHARRSDAADRKRDIRPGKCLTSAAATGSEVAVTAFSSLLDVLADILDPRRILKANQSDTPSQDRCRAALAGINNLLPLACIQKR